MCCCEVQTKAALHLAEQLRLLFYCLFLFRLKKIRIRCQDRDFLSFEIAIVCY